MAAPIPPHYFQQRKNPLPTPTPSLLCHSPLLPRTRAPSFSIHFLDSFLALRAGALRTARECSLFWPGSEERRKEGKMGSCASVHKDDVGLPQKLLKEGAVDGKGGAPVGDVLVDLKRKIEEQGGFGYSKSHDSGSKDEMFFESRGWLDSDCEDDFHSVNGDFTPSRGSTPNYQPRANTVMSNVFLPNNVHDSKSSEPSPTGRRKLSELLQEAMQNGPEENTDTATGEPDSSKNGEQQQPQSVAAAEKPVSESSTGCSTEPTPAREARSRKERAWYAGHCCLPTFVHSLTLEEDGGRQKTGPGPVAV